MKFGGWPKRPGKHTPLCTVAEIAKEFGLTPHQLGGFMTHSPATPPKPVFTHKTTWYQAAEMRAWWKAHKEKTK